MGWVTYNNRGNFVKYYKKPGPAKAAVTRAQRDKQFYGRAVYPNVAGFCSYKDFEGVLMGLRGDALRMWQFCNTEIG